MKKFLILLVIIYGCNREKSGIIAYNVKVGKNKSVYIKDLNKNEIIKKYISKHPEEYYSFYDTVDITGNGIAEIIIEHYSGGTHCCTDYIILDISNKKLKEIWNFYASNGSILKIEDIEGDGIKEIITACDCLAYFADLPYYVSRFLPRIFKYNDGNFYECTMEYPGIFDPYVEKFCKGIKEAENDVEEKSNYLALMAIHILRGKTLQGHLKSEKCGSSVETINWFYFHRDELLKRLKEYYNF